MSELITAAINLEPWLKRASTNLDENVALSAFREALAATKAGGSKRDRLTQAEHLLGLALVAMTESGADGFYHRPTDGRRVSIRDEIDGFISRGCGSA